MQMETYPVDLDAGQIVRWVMAEQQIEQSTFRILARRATEVREIPPRKEFHLGDQEREDLSEIATVATLEIAPFHSYDGWRLTIVVEDEAGPRIPDKRAAIGGEEEIDLGAFYKEFIRPGRGSANVTVEVEDSAARARMTRLLNNIETNRHGHERS
jgi:hypothetical protein